MAVFRNLKNYYYRKFTNKVILDNPYRLFPTDMQKIVTDAKKQPAYPLYKADCVIIDNLIDKHEGDTVKAYFEWLGRLSDTPERRKKFFRLGL